MQVIDNIPEFRKEPLVVLLLGFITCGLYLIYWNLQASKVFNALAGREILSSVVAVFAGCIWPVNMYFFFIVGRDGIPAIDERIGVHPRDQSILLMLLGFFFPIIAAMIVQSEINKLYK
ncbi:MAG: hypothetical protein BWX62_01180 [Bacteroidetes bacterium ADurb.Bin037]|nr:MAG: hypothetical protein BWX62_01180 [Bacteroidetes bacterium ADurb.Bin037]HPW77686.1 DUF4234 domain-containing protein [Bacteroidales bacterium]HQB55507.1 DUF4234 domain-containing protein [Bacteroidales bacterium]